MAAPAPRFRVVVVDDEPLARRRLRRMLSDDDEITVVAECGDGADAVTTIGAHRPDIVFLDVEMPEKDGFAVVEALGDTAPAVVFVTAHPHYAVRAFEASALDYLLKPFDRARLARAVARAKERRREARQGDVAAEVRRILGDIHQAGAPRRILVPIGDKAVFVNLAEVDCIEAEANYVRLHIGASTHLVRESLSSLEQRLAGGPFRRVHRSTLVNLDAVREVHAWFHGESRLRLRSGREIKVSRNYKKNVSDLLG